MFIYLENTMTIHDLNLTPAIKRHAIARSFAAHDGTKIAFRHWPAPGVRTPRGAVVLLHRGHEHSGRMDHLATELGLHDFDIYAWDARGHGLSDGAGDAHPGFDTMVRDLDDFVAHLRDKDGWSVSDISLVAQSAGAVIASTWVHDYAPHIRGMVLAAAAFEINLFVPGARQALGIWQRLRGRFTVNSFVRPWMLSRNTTRAASYTTDPHITPGIQSNVLFGLFEAGDRVVADAATIMVPTQVLIPGSDWVAHSRPQHAFYQSLGTDQKMLRVYPDMRHDLLGEEDRAQAVGDAREFLLQCFARPVSTPAANTLAQITQNEAEVLAQPVERSWAGMKWAAIKTALRLGARVSTGLKLGQEAGFDSGAMLDHVYRNKAEGTGPIGRMIDRIYLNSVGWRGIRARKRMAEEMISLAAKRLDGQGTPLRIVDIAAGHGRYVLDGLASTEVQPESVVLRDYCPKNVASGRDFIAERGLSDIARFEQADAFDAKGLAALTPRPTLAIVSGLYELFEDNALVSTSLRGVAEAVPAGGMLIYTNQPWHPQLEMIARTLTSHRGGTPWVMRRRSQAEMDQLVAEAGFTRITQQVDRWGIFTVSLAVRGG